MNHNILEQKKAIVEEVSSLLKDSGSVIVAEYRGLNVAEISELKRALLKGLF